MSAKKTMRPDRTTFASPEDGKNTTKCHLLQGSDHSFTVPAPWSYILPGQQTWVELELRKAPLTEIRDGREQRRDSRRRS